MDQAFDFIVLGSGPAGQRAAVQAAKLGKRVAIIENGKPGGGSAHWGTIPSKSLREAALRPHCSWIEARKFSAKVIRQEEKTTLASLARNNIRFFPGSGRFLDSHSISCEGLVLSGKKILIATGARPLQAAEFPFGWAGIFDSDSILGMKKLPKTLLILGVGVIGCEYASIFEKMGVKVTLLDRRKELLRAVDDEITKVLREEFSEAGVKLCLGASIGDFKRLKGSAKLPVKVDSKALLFEAILICMGRAPNTATLELARAGVAADERGHIQVNEKLQTNIPHIYAAGDVIGPPALAATSSEQGRAAACHAFAAPCEESPSLFPSGIYTIPEIASAGFTESELVGKNIPFVVGRASYSELSRGHILGDKRGLLKILVHKESQLLLGTHIIGKGASDLVHIGLLLQSLGAPVSFLRRSVFNYPTLAEAYKVAAHNALNQLSARN